MFDLVYGHGALYGCYFTNHINYVLGIVVNGSPLTGDYSTATNWSFSVSRVVIVSRSQTLYLRTALID